MKGITWKKLLLFFFAVIALNSLFRIPDEVNAFSPEDYEAVRIAAPFILGAVIIAILATIVGLHIRRKRPEPIPQNPASTAYNIGIKLFSTFAFLLVLALSGLAVVENLGSWKSSPAAVQQTTTYVRTYLWGVKLGTTTSSTPVGSNAAAGALGIFLVSLVSMLVLCAEDWTRKFGVPDKKRILLAIFCGYTGIWYLLNGDKGGGFIRLGFFLIGCLCCLAHLLFGAPSLFAGLLIITILWTREIIKSANGA